MTPWAHLLPLAFLCVFISPALPRLKLSGSFEVGEVFVVKVNVNGKGYIYLPLHDSWYFKGTLSHSRKYKQSPYFQKKCIVFFPSFWEKTTLKFYPLYMKNYIQGSAGIVFYVCFRTISVVPMGGAWKDNSIHTKYLKMPKINMHG